MTIADDRSAQQLPTLKGRFTAETGKHKGAEVEVVRVTDGGSVIVRPVGGNGVGVGKQKFDEATRWTLNRDHFLAQYSANGTRTPVTSQPGKAFRRQYMAKQQAALLETEPIVLAPPDTRNGNGKAALAVPTVSTRGTPLDITVELITPLLAQEWLERGGMNRTLSQRRVLILSEAIKNGEWQITGDAIKLDADGRVRDGQHRLHAIVESGIAVQSLVVRNVAEAAFVVMDTGRARTAKDVLSMRGLPNSTALASAIRNLILVEKFGRLDISTIQATGALSIPAVDAYERTHPEVREGLRLGDTVRASGFVGGAGVWGFCFTLFLRCSGDYAEEFRQSMIKGDGLANTDARLILRNRLIQQKEYWRTKTSEDKEQLAATIIKAWNAWRRGDVLEHGWRSLSWHNIGRAAEKFPTPE